MSHRVEPRYGPHVALAVLAVSCTAAARTLRTCVHDVAAASCNAPAPRSRDLLTRDAWADEYAACPATPPSAVASAAAALRGCARHLSWSQYALLYAACVAAFLSLLYVVESLRERRRRVPRRLLLTDAYVDGTPPHVDVATAFAYDTPATTPYERAKMLGFVLSGVAPMRLCVFALALCSAFALHALVGSCNAQKHALLVRAMTLLGVMAAYVALAAVGVYAVHVYGSVASRHECTLLIGNHSCVIEVMLLFLLAHYPSFVSRKENGAIPLFARSAAACEAIIVDRDAAVSRRQTLAAIRARVQHGNARQLMIFPEGTTDNQRALFLFKKGAFEAGAPVQMVCVYFPYRHFNPAWTGRMVGGNSMGDLLLRMCCQFVTHAEVRVLPVYHPTAAERSDAVAYAAHCQRMMATVLQMTVSTATYGDFAAAAQAYRAAHAQQQQEQQQEEQQQQHDDKHDASESS